MAHLPVLPDTYRVALNWAHSNGQIAVNVIHIHDNSGTITDSQLRTELDSANQVNMWASVSVHAGVQDIAITKLDGLTGTTHGPPVTPSNWVGGNPDPYIPNQAVIVKLTTGLRGRSHRGRVFLPFSSTSVVTDGQVNPATAALISTAWSTFETDLLASGHSLELVVASYKLVTTAVVLTPINAELVAGTQRRRQGRLRGA